MTDRDAIIAMLRRSNLSFSEEACLEQGWTQIVVRPSRVTFRFDRDGRFGSLAVGPKP